MAQMQFCGGEVLHDWLTSRGSQGCVQWSVLRLSELNKILVSRVDCVIDIRLQHLENRPATCLEFFVEFIDIYIE